MKNRNKIKLDPGTRALRIISYVFVRYILPEKIDENFVIKSIEVL